MKMLRIPASLGALVFVSLLAACGGGGGGGTTTPPVNNPGGGGGGGVTPTPGATATPTAPPSVAPTSTPPPITTSSSTYTAYDAANHSQGTNGWQKNGVTAAGHPEEGDTVNNVGQGQSTDGLSACALSAETQMTSNSYHVHAFVGIYVNGQAFAVPAAIGMASPGPVASDGIETFSCAYSIHTHSASGIIHIEDPTITQPYTKVSAPSQYNLKTLLDVWGQTLASVGQGQALTGIYTGTPSAQTSSGADIVTSYQPNLAAMADPSTLLLSHHVAIWLVYGTPPAAFPQIVFGISN